MSAAKRILRERYIRARHFPHLDEPAWLMLVDLAAEPDRHVSVTSACLASFVPATTALRHIGILESMGLVDRAPDPEDRRRVWLRLTTLARELLDRFFNDLNSAPTRTPCGADSRGAFHPTGAPAASCDSSTAFHEATNA